MSEIILTNPHIDARAQRTRHLLATALMELGAENDVDELKVGDLIEAAGVSRSTFYAHFASKDDFMVRSFVDLLSAAENAYAERFPDRTELFASKPIFHHVHEAGEFARRVAASSAFAPQMAAGELKVRALVEANLERQKPQWSADRRKETAIYVAAGFIGLLRWWMTSGLKQTPERMQEVFERLSRSALNDEV